MNRSDERLAERRADRPVEGADHPERRDRIGREGLEVGLLRAPGDRDPAGVRVLDDHAGGQLELAQQELGAVEVVGVDSESGRPCSWVMLESRWRRAPASR